MIFVNFKTYKNGSGERAVVLVKIMGNVAASTQIKIIPVVQLIDLRSVVSVTKLEVWVQKIDPISYGAHTGAALPEEVVNAGARGTFLNHSENKIQEFEDLRTSIEKARQVGLKTLLFSSSLQELERNTALKPDFLAYEPPELVGSTETSVATAQPEIIAKAVVIAKNAGVPLVVGAGINSQNDVRKSLQLGAVGVAVATDVVKATKPREELMDLTEGFK